MGTESGMSETCFDVTRRWAKTGRAHDINGWWKRWWRCSKIATPTPTERYPASGSRSWLSQDRPGRSRSLMREVGRVGFGQDSAGAWLVTAVHDPGWSGSRELGVACFVLVVQVCSRAVLDQLSSTQRRMSKVAPFLLCLKPCTSGTTSPNAHYQFGTGSFPASVR